MLPPFKHLIIKASLIVAVMQYILVVDTGTVFGKGLLCGEFLMNKHVFGFPGSTSGSHLIKLDLLVCQVVTPGPDTKHE